jgi:hypothetical protein
MTAQMGADRHVKSEWLTIVEFSIIFFYKSFYRFSSYFVPKDRQTDKKDKLEGTFLVSKDLLEKFLKAGGWGNKLSLSHLSSHK